jgi:quinolinate synthase
LFGLGFPNPIFLTVKGDIMQTLYNVLNWIESNILWGIPMLILIIPCGVFLTVRKKAFQVTKFGYAIKQTMRRSIRQMKGENPKAKAVCYVNSTAEVKAECDICVTSGNTAQVMKKFLPDEEILFVPDQHLGSHIMKILGRDYKLWPGYCPVHAMITSSDVEKARLEYPGAVVMVHPECSKEVREAADEQLSTGKMCEFARISDKNEFVVGTELGILHRLRKENPDKKFYPINENVVCVDMKKITLEKLRDSMKFNEFVVKVPEDIALRARKAIMAMLSI